MFLLRLIYSFVLYILFVCPICIHGEHTRWNHPVNTFKFVCLDYIPKFAHSEDNWWTHLPFCVVDTSVNGEQNCKSFYILSHCRFEAYKMFHLIFTFDVIVNIRLTHYMFFWSKFVKLILQPVSLCRGFHDIYDDVRIRILTN